MARIAFAACLMTMSEVGLGMRIERKAMDSCAKIGCGTRYNRRWPCQCNDRCDVYSNCCSDYNAKCKASGPGPSPGPSPGPISGPVPNPSPTPQAPGAAVYWAGVNTDSRSAVAQKMRSGTRRLSYGNLWNFYVSSWTDLPGTPFASGCIFDVYSLKCWTPRSNQCGNYRREGDCYNREHSWPKSWWGGGTNEAYSDVFHVVPSDGYVNSKRSALPFGNVNVAKYTSSEGNKVGSCSCGTCFEPTDRVKGMLARAHLYVETRYGYSMESCSMPAILEWASNFAPQAWEVEFNNRAQDAQGNRNIFIDFPEKAAAFFG